jgi:hypothetical protein
MARDPEAAGKEDRKSGLSGRKIKNRRGESLFFYFRLIVIYLPDLLNVE